MKAWIFSIFRKIWVFAKRALTWYVCKNKNDPLQKEDDHTESSYPSATQNNRRRKFLKEDDHVEDE